MQRRAPSGACRALGSGRSLAAAQAARGAGPAGVSGRLPWGGDRRCACRYRRRSPPPGAVSGPGSEPLTESAISVTDLSKRYGTVTAVASLSFDLASGRVLGLLGGNGAGKTTTLAMLMGLLLPSTGSIRVLGEDLLRHRYRVLPWINFSSPYVDLPHRLTVYQNLRVYAGLYGVRHARSRIDELARDLDLTELLDRPYGRLSAGQKTRASLAKALINRPRLLLLDEPTASLDPDTADRLRTYLRDYQEASGAGVVLASHNMLEVERLCHEVIMLRHGRIFDRGAPADLIGKYGRETLEEVFLDMARGRSQL
ncbi:ABC transporter ATP-binding protein [Acidiferrobacter thiooxydans]|uniref:ABC transporter ATP-binding protein n=1 Tax=Acidiferrobacter thiooxydans TaxID=163359 RepID=A0A368HI78_9GAMM|nr:ABC transporter ATP-binding protein [Acidiferrobacter thiooxydans]